MEEENCKIYLLLRGVDIAEINHKLIHEFKDIFFYQSHIVDLSTLINLEYLDRKGSLNMLFDSGFYYDNIITIDKNYTCHSKATDIIAIHKYRHPLYNESDYSTLSFPNHDYIQILMDKVFAPLKNSILVMMFCLSQLDMLKDIRLIIGNILWDDRVND